MFRKCVGTALQKESIVDWLILISAGILEIVWAVGLKYTEGFTRLWPSVITLCALTASFLLLGISLRSLPLGTAYAVWVGIGAVGTALVGILVLNEPATLIRIASLLLILAGVIGLKISHG